MEKMSESRYVSQLDVATAQLGLRHCDAALKSPQSAMNERVMRVTELNTGLFDAPIRNSAGSRRRSFSPHP
jgi:hypothetical protein